MYFNVEIAAYFDNENKYFKDWVLADYRDFQTKEDAIASITPEDLEPNICGKRNTYRIIRISQKTGKRRVVAEIFGEGEK